MWRLLLCVFLVSATASLAGDLVVTGTVNCADRNTNSLTASASVQVTASVSVQSLTAASLEAGQVTANSLVPSGDVLRIQGDVVISRTSLLLAAAVLAISVRGRLRSGRRRVD